MTYVRTLLLAGAASLVLLTGVQAADPVLSGAISTASGQKMEGVTVYAKMEGSTVTTTVYTDESGGYYFPPLPAGKYRVWAQALGFETARGTVDLTTKRRHDLVMQSMTDAERRVRQMPRHREPGHGPVRRPDRIAARERQGPFHPPRRTGRGPRGPARPAASGCRAGCTAGYRRHCVPGGAISRSN